MAPSLILSLDDIVDGISKGAIVDRISKDAIIINISIWIGFVYWDMSSQVTSLNIHSTL